ncbi:MAG: septal ring lytic transglycosylase RlpA family protein [Polyangiales bacterium]
MKRITILLALVACGPPPIRVVMTAPSPERSDVDSTEVDEVDREAGHDEPEDPEDPSSSGTVTGSTTATTAAPPPHRPREPVVSADAPVLETLSGRVSYYSDRLAGRSTASGEPYRTREFTAASRDLPFGTLVRVVRLSRAGNEELGSVVVRVNDRGPFGDHRRILDLSRAAAEALDMVSAGVVPVRAEILRRGR